MWRRVIANDVSSRRLLQEWSPLLSWTLQPTQRGDRRQLGSGSRHNRTNPRRLLQMEWMVVTKGEGGSCLRWCISIAVCATFPGSTDVPRHPWPVDYGTGTLLHCGGALVGRVEVLQNAGAEWRRDHNTVLVQEDTIMYIEWVVDGLKTCDVGIGVVALTQDEKSNFRWRFCSGNVTEMYIYATRNMCDRARFGDGYSNFRAARFRGSAHRFHAFPSAPVSWVNAAFPNRRFRDGYMHFLAFPLRVAPKNWSGILLILQNFDIFLYCVGYIAISNREAMVILQNFTRCSSVSWRIHAFPQTSAGQESSSFCRILIFSSYSGYVLKFHTVKLRVICRISPLLLISWSRNGWVL